MRLQIFLSRCGICSRRKALANIESGKVTVNNKIITEPSYSIQSPPDIVTFNGRPVVLKEEVYILLNKPAGVVTTSWDRFAKKTVFDLLPAEFKYLHCVGRLDKDTTGLLLLTNDGGLTYRLTHPSFEVQKVYKVTLNRMISDTDKSRLEKGISLDDGKTSPCVIKRESSGQLDLTIHEGKKRQVRRMFASLGYRVIALSRIRQGSLALGNLEAGKWRFLKDEEVEELYKELKMENRA